MKRKSRKRDGCTKKQISKEAGDHNRCRRNSVKPSAEKQKIREQNKENGNACRVFEALCTESTEPDRLSLATNRPNP